MMTGFMPFDCSWNPPVKGVPMSFSCFSRFRKQGRSKYSPHQGEQEKTRRAKACVRQLQRARWKR